MRLACTCPHQGRASCFPTPPCNPRAEAAELSRLVEELSGSVAASTTRIAELTQRNSGERGGIGWNQGSEEGTKRKEPDRVEARVGGSH